MKQTIHKILSDALDQIEREFEMVITSVYVTALEDSHTGDTCERVIRTEGRLKQQGVNNEI